MGLSVSEPVEGLLRELEHAICKAGRLGGPPFELCFVECVSSDGRAGRAVTPGLHELSARLEPSVPLGGRSRRGYR